MTRRGGGMQDRILVFIPMYNCARQIGRVLAQLQNAAVAAHLDGVIGVDNGSTDETLAVARQALGAVPVRHRALLRNNDNYGLGGSHKVAIGYALEHGYSHLIVLHGDDQGSIADLLPYLESGAYREVDCLLGARFMPGSRLEGYSRLRTWANVVFNNIFSAVAGQRLYDLGSGLNLYRTAIFRNGFHLKFADNLTFNYYLILGTCLSNLSHRFFPLSWREDDQVSNAKLFRQGRQMLRLLAHRIVDADGFLNGEHRTIARSSYPSTIVSLWEGTGHVERPAD